jgi:hypothetical protein
MDYIPKVGDIAEYTFPDMDGKPGDETVTGAVVSVGKTYADVSWRDGGRRPERIRFRELRGVTFKAS